MSDTKASPETRPNILFIMADQWAGSLLGIAGHPTIQTPTLDQLAANGTWFPRAYSESPVCIPARRTVMTGTTPRRHGDRVFKPAEHRAIRRAFYALCTHIDHQIRVLIGTLREEGLLDDTVILFTTDHGDMLGDFGLWAKRLFYEGSARVPMILSGRAGAGLVDAGLVDYRLVGLQDVMPTLLDAAGIPIPETVEGLSMLGAARRELFYGECGEDVGASRMMHDGQHKLIWYPLGNRVQLFDLADDPREQVDRGDDPSLAPQRDRLAAALAEQAYGVDQAWVDGSELVGAQAPPYAAVPNRGFSGQRPALPAAAAARGCRRGRRHAPGLMAQPALEEQDMIGIALFGAGAMGTAHARNVAASKDCRLLHVVDLDLARAQQVAQQCGGAPAASPEAALGDAEVDAVIIASSTSAHEAHVLASAEAGKAFLCEKPLADSLERAVACVAAAERAGVVAAMGFNRRLDPPHRALHERVGAGEIGVVEMLHMVSRTHAPPTPESVPFSGGMIREKGTHFYDLAAWIAGLEPVEVYAAGTCLIDPRLADHGDVDTAALTLRFDSGALATFDFGRRTAYGFDELIEVFGSEGLLESRRQRPLSVSLYKGRQVIDDGLHATSYDRVEGTYPSELDAFVAAVRDGAAVHASLADGLRAQAVAEAAVRSIAENRPVAIEGIW